MFADGTSYQGKGRITSDGVRPGYRGAKTGFRDYVNCLLAEALEQTRPAAHPPLARAAVKHILEVKMSQNDPISTLQLYGLDHVLTDQDDPRLWAAALAKHWPRPDDPQLHDRPIFGSPRFRFGIGNIPDESEKARGAPMLTIIESWSFERTDDKHFRATRGNPEYPHFILDISRPSVGTDMAWVLAGENPAPMIGYGEIKVWVRQEDGSWIETDEVVSAWIS